MTLKAVIDDISAVPEALRAFYTPHDGHYALAVEGLVPKARLDEFRDNNIKLVQERDALRQQFDGIDPEKARALLARAQKEHDKRLVDAGTIDELVAQRVEAMRADYEARLSGEAEKSQAMQSRLETLLIDGAIRDAAAKAGIRPSAIEDVLLRGRTIFKLLEGKAVPMQGDDVLYSKTGEAMTMDEWLNSLVGHAPHLFEPNRGAGAAGGAASALGQKYIEAGDVNGFLSNLADIARHNLRVG